MHVTNASSLSAYNPVEHRMAPFSHDLTGIILPWDTFGSHLDDAGNTIDHDLEVKNFYAAGEIVSEVLSKTVINGFETDCQSVKGQYFQKKILIPILKAKPFAISKIED